MTPTEQVQRILELLERIAIALELVASTPVTPASGRKGKDREESV
jgi:hypothetical protein